MTATTDYAMLFTSTPWPRRPLGIQHQEPSMIRQVFLQPKLLEAPLLLRTREWSARARCNADFVANRVSPQWEAVN
jgi:hypothetical protein